MEDGNKENKANKENKETGGIRNCWMAGRQSWPESGFRHRFSVCIWQMTLNGLFEYVVHKTISNKCHRRTEGGETLLFCSRPEYQNI